MKDKIREKHGFFNFSATDVFDDNLFRRIDAGGAKHEDYSIMWRQVLESRLITGVRMTPGWKRSKGATDEYQTALKMGLAIQFIDKSGTIIENAN